MPRHPQLYAWADRVATAWQVADPPRKLWSIRYPARPTSQDDIGFGGADAQPEREVGVVLVDHGGPDARQVHGGQRDGVVRVHVQDDEIGEVREDWEHKKADPSVPGAAGDREKAEQGPQPETNYPSKGDED